MPYTLDETLKVMRSVIPVLKENPERLKEQGVLRLASDLRDKESLIHALIAGTAHGLEEKSIHLLLDSIKTTASLHGSRLFSNDDPLLEPMKELLKNEPKASADEVMRALDALILKLVETRNEDNLKKAEIIHNLVHLNWQVTQYSDANQMTAENASIACLGPFLLYTLNLSGGAEGLEVLPLVNKVNELGALTLEGGEGTEHAFNRPFEERYQPQLAAIKEAKAQEHERIEQMPEHKKLQEISSDIMKHYKQHRQEQKQTKRSSFFSTHIRRRGARDKQIAILDKAFQHYLQDPSETKHQQALQTAVDTVKKQLKKEGTQKIGGMEKLVQEIETSLKAIQEPKQEAKTKIKKS